MYESTVLRCMCAYLLQGAFISDSGSATGQPLPLPVIKKNIFKPKYLIFPLVVSFMHVI